MQENTTTRKPSIDSVHCNASLAPAPAPSVGELPTSLTFFLSTDERRLVLQKLKQFKGDRRTALLRALRVDAETAINRGIHHG